MPESEVLLKPEQVAQMLGVSVHTLTDWRYHKRGPKFTKLSRKAVRYTLADVKDFRESCDRNFHN